MELLIPPVDGIYYDWKDGDTFETVAEKLEAKPEDIINFPGNNIDLTNPKVEPGTTVMVPGGSRELRAWEADLITMSRSNDAVRAHLILAATPVAAVRWLPVLAGLQMLTAFLAMAMAQDILELILQPRKALLFMPLGPVCDHGGARLELWLCKRCTN